jgi:hypothetical protein
LPRRKLPRSAPDANENFLYRVVGICDSMLVVNFSGSSGKAKIFLRIWSTREHRLIFRIAPRKFPDFSMKNSAKLRETR